MRGNSNNMKKISILSIALLAAVMTSCQVVGDIFSAGFYIGAFVVVFVIGTILLLVLRGRK
jgi:ABC-type enterochelin transport system permease subunit